MKRNSADDSPRAKKRQRIVVEVKEGDSIYDQAAPYLLATARFPIDALTSQWSNGINRPIDQAHKRRLRQVFNEVGVFRRDRSHRLQIACSKAEVQKMLHHLEEHQACTAAAAAKGADEVDLEWPSFEDWLSVVGSKVELIAGHHRVEAFKEYLQLRELPEKERWWVCSIYDNGFIPCLCQLM